jgi:hypothetical protein
LNHCRFSSGFMVRDAHRSQVYARYAHLPA